jgi:hypothetical protein
MSTPVFLEPQLGHFIEKFLYKAFFLGEFFCFVPVRTRRTWEIFLDCLINKLGLGNTL